MANYLLPELKPAQIDPIGSFARGFMLPGQFIRQYDENALSKAKIDAANREEAARKAYAESGGTDRNALLQFNPIEANKLGLEERKINAATIKPGLDLAYALLPSITEETYPAIRERLVKDFPAMDYIAPQVYDPEKIRQFRDSWERSKKLEDKTQVLAPGGMQVRGGKVLVSNPPLPSYKTGTQYNEEGMPQTIIFDIRKGPVSVRTIGGGKKEAFSGAVGDYKNALLHLQKTGQEVTPENISEAMKVVRPTQERETPENKMVNQIYTNLEKSIEDNSGYLSAKRKALEANPNLDIGQFRSEYMDWEAQRLFQKRQNLGKNSKSTVGMKPSAMPSGYQGPGYYSVNGQEVRILNQDDFNKAMGQ